MLAILSDFIPSIPPVSIDGVYGPATKAAVLAVQRRFLLPETGSVDARTWNEIYDQFSGIENTTLRSKETFPAPNLAPQASNRAVAAGNFNQRRTSPAMSVHDAANQQYRRTTTLTQFPGQDLRMGMQDPISQEVVR
jgi:peptidoglycan hydrolase-like protein with peptidoglycan-binding domain